LKTDLHFTDALIRDVTTKYDALHLNGAAMCMTVMATADVVLEIVPALDITGQASLKTSQAINRTRANAPWNPLSKINLVIHQSGGFLSRVLLAPGGRHSVEYDLKATGVRKLRVCQPPHPRARAKCCLDTHCALCDIAAK
jgi:hypothetical protein